MKSLAAASDKSLGDKPARERGYKHTMNQQDYNALNQQSSEDRVLCPPISGHASFLALGTSAPSAQHHEDTTCSALTCKRNTKLNVK